MIIKFFFNDTKKIIIEKNRLKAIIKLILEDKKREPGNITIIFTSDKVIRNINKEFLNHDYFTDIITFQNNRKGIVNGELYISIDSIKRNSTKYASSNYYLELYRVIIHGILHLVGLDDKAEWQKLQMKKEEDYYLNALNLQSDSNR